MKVIDLLNKIANGEQPQKIKYYDTIYNFEEYRGDWGYVNKEYGKYNWFAKEIDCDLQNCLNDEVEIIEEDKKIRKLPNEVQEPKNFEEVVYIAEDLARKINEIIDYINKGE